MSIEMNHIPDLEGVDLEKIISDALALIAPSIVENIQSQWPVNTGKSRNAMDSNISSDKTSVSLNVTNAVDYVPFIHPKNSKILSVSKADIDLQSNADQINGKLIEAILDSLNNAKDKS